MRGIFIMRNKMFKDFSKNKYILKNIEKHFTPDGELGAFTLDLCEKYSNKIKYKFWIGFLGGNLPPDGQFQIDEIFPNFHYGYGGTPFDLNIIYRNSSNLIIKINNIYIRRFGFSKIKSVELQILIENKFIRTTFSKVYDKFMLDYGRNYL